MSGNAEHIRKSEAELLSLLKNGDEEAFATLFYAYKDKLYGFLRSITKSDANAKDLLQDVFLKIWQNRTQLDGIENFNAYIFFVAQNQAIDQFRKSSKELFSSVELLNLEADVVTPDPADALINKEAREKINEAVNQLPPQQKKIFVLHNEYGFKHHEIAVQLNISVSTTQNHMREALRNLRAYLAQVHLIISFLIVISTFSFLF